MRLFQLAGAASLLAFALACGSSTPPPAATPVSSVDPATAATVTATVKFEGEVPAAEMITITGDPKCVSENGGPQRAEERVVVGDNQALQNVFVYVKDGLTAYGFPMPAEPVLLDQDKCRYTPRVVGVRVGQALQVRNSDPLLHNVRSNGIINQAFNKSTPVEGVSFTHTFATREVMVPFKCDVHGWMSAYVGVLDHPYFGTTGANGTVTFGNLPPGTYTIEAWHESLGTREQTITIGSKETKDVSFAFTR